MNLLARLFAVCLVASSCAHSDGEKGGVVRVKASREDVQKAFSGRRFALLVGISRSGDERWQRLRFANKDVDDLGAVLRDPQHGNFTFVESLTTPQDTTRDRIAAAVARVASMATQPEDVLLVYLSAHGTLARDKGGELERYLVTSDAQYRAVAETALKVDHLSKALSSSKSRRRVLVLATCHSGSGKSLLTEEAVDELASRKGPLLRPLEDVSRASIVLSASDFLETAREDVGLQNDVYTHFLVKALSGEGDRNGDGAVTATEAHDFSRRRTYTFSKGRQRPTAELVEVGADPVVLSGQVSRGGRPELYSYVQRLDGFKLRIDGEERTELPGGAAVGAGRHRVELTKGDEVLLSEEVVLADGDRLDVESLARKKEPWVSMSLTGGAFGFVDAKSQSQLLPFAPTVGASARLERALPGNLSLELDASGFGGQQSLRLYGQDIPFGWSAFLFGTSVLWQWDSRWFSFWVGPRVAGIWVRRSFALDVYNKTQNAFSVTPGALLGAAIRLTPNWELSLNAQMMVVFMTVDSTTQFLGFAGGWAGVGYRF